MLSLLIGGTTYTFSLILAAFLVGIGIGSAAASAFARDARRARLALGWCQALLALGIAWAAYMLSASLPFWPIDPSLADSPWFNFQIDFVRSLWAVLPATLLWGASFPLALAALVTEGHDPARLVGPRVRREHRRRHRRLARDEPGARGGDRQPAHAAAADPPVRPLGAGRPGTGGGTRSRGACRGAASRWSWWSIMAGCGTLMARAVPELPGLLVAYGRFTATKSNQGEVLYMGEGLSSSVAVTRLGERHPELPQRRQGAGVERPGGHAAPADARAPDDADARPPEVGARDRLRRRRDGRRGVGRPGGREGDDRRDRAARGPHRRPRISAATTTTSSATRRSRCASTMRGTSW